MKKSKLISFHGDESVKEKYLNRLRDHAKADEIIQGKYWENGKGCAVGCTIHSSKHGNYESELGISWRLAIMEDRIFEGLPNTDAKIFPLQFLESMPIGIDTDIVFKKLIIWSLTDEKDGLINIVKHEKVKELLKETADTYQLSFKKEIPETRWRELQSKASADAYASAYAYADAYASAYAYAYASAYADAYAYASADAYVSAYASAYAYADASADRKKVFQSRIIIMRDKLLDLLKNSK